MMYTKANKNVSRNSVCIITYKCEREKEKKEKERERTDHFWKQRRNKCSTVSKWYQRFYVSI